MDNNEKSYCLICKEKTGNTNIETRTSKTGRPYKLSVCDECGKRKCKYPSKNENTTLTTEDSIKKSKVKIIPKQNHTVIQNGGQILLVPEVSVDKDKLDTTIMLSLIHI